MGLRTRCGAAVAIGFFLALSTSVVRAGELVTNGSFESPGYDPSWLLKDGTYYPSPFEVPTGWSGTGQVSVNLPGTQAYPYGVPDGVQVAVDGLPDDVGDIFQDVPATLSLGTVYTLTGFVGSRLDYPGSGEIDLETSTGDILASSGSITPPDGMFQSVYLTYQPQSGDPDLGDGLRISLLFTGGNQASYDAISLTADSVPEPVSIGLLGLAAVGLLGKPFRARRMS
jgi:hypothetical protein